MKILVFYIFFALFSISNSFGQDTIILKNPSFEGKPSASVDPEGWTACGMIDESAVDIQPGFYGVKKKAAHGNTYLGMVVRDNNTWESVCQKLPVLLKKDSVYEFSAVLAKSKKLLSYSRAQIEASKKPENANNTTIIRDPVMNHSVEVVGAALYEVNYDTPVIVQIWGGNEICQAKELLAKSPPISNTDWVKYEFQFQPKERDYLYFFLEAFYEDGKPVYNGNILIDNCSPIIQIKPTTNN